MILINPTFHPQSQLISVLLTEPKCTETDLKNPRFVPFGAKFDIHGDCINLVLRSAGLLIEQIYRNTSVQSTKWQFSIHLMKMYKSNV